MKKTDPTIELIRSVYKQNVPLQEELSNPFNANKRRNKKSVPKLSLRSSSPIEEWDAKFFVRYFADEYKRVIGGVYKVTFASDVKLIYSILGFMEDNNLEKNVYTKKFLDWCFENKDMVVSIHGHFLLNTIKDLLNRYYQDQIIPQNKILTLIDIIDDIHEMFNNNLHREIYLKFGIPIACTYFVNHQNYELSDVIENSRKLFMVMIKGNADQKKLLGEIFQKSISRSPYIKNMLMMDWRSEFSDMTERYKKEIWWKDSDYSGNSRFDYNKLLK
jgi:hypothetical protein